MWTKEQIKQKLEVSDQWVERAIVAIYDRQTQDEQIERQTTKCNGVGFAACHASKGSYYAKWISSGKSLSGTHLENARKIAMKYIRQLTEIANNSVAS